MPKLRDYFFSDLSNVFLNIDEFAEMHDVDGQHIPAVVDSEILRVRSNNKSEQYDGIYANQVAVYIKEVDLPERPVHGQQMHLDGKMYMVLECAGEQGILEITLGVNES